MKAKKEVKPTKEKAPKTYLVRRYEFKAPETDKAKALAKRLLDDGTETQAATLLKFVKDGKGVTFAEILAFVKAAEKGKPEETLERNYRWHLAKLGKAGLVRTVENREAKAAE